MPYDMLLCTGEGCPQKENCYRFTRPVYGRQDFFGSPPYKKDTGECEHFMSNKPSLSAIRDMAYRYYVEENYVQGKELEHWLRAEKTLQSYFEKK